MTENNTSQFIQKLAEREGVSTQKIQEIVTTSFRNSYRQNGNEAAELHFEFNDKLLVYRVYQIVEKVNNPDQEITLDNKLIKKGKVKNGVFFCPVDTTNLSFSLSQEIKNRLRKDVEEISWEKQHKLFQSQQGQLIKGYIKSIPEKDYYLVDLGKKTGYWAKSEWKLREEPRPGQPFYFLIKELREKTEKNAPQAILTRADNLFIHRLFEQEIPEVKNQIIVIRDVLRLPGFLSKVIIESKNSHLNAVGTCIGKDSSRIRSISQIAYPERVEIVLWQENKNELFFNLISPFKWVISLIEKENDHWEVIVPTSKMSLILVEGGQVLKMIGDYLGKTIHIQTIEKREKQGNYNIVWNGNLSFEEYQSLL